jgi:hypothetical protein
MARIAFAPLIELAAVLGAWLAFEPDFPVGSFAPDALFGSEE